MNDEFAKKFPLTNMLMKPAKELSEDEFSNYCDSLTKHEISQFMKELVILQFMVDYLGTLPPDELKYLKMMSNYQNN
jgi:hypothetical protein